jgi:hypothetical protein
LTNEHTNMSFHIQTDIYWRGNDLCVKIYVEWYEDDEICGSCNDPLTRICECESEDEQIVVNLMDCPCNVMVCWNEKCTDFDPIIQSMIEL